MCNYHGCACDSGLPIDNARVSLQMCWGVCVCFLMMRVCGHQVKLVRSSPQSEVFKSTLEESHALFAKYQMAIHKEPAEDCTMRDVS